MMNKRAVGNTGEELAVEFLLKKRFKITQRNYNCRIGEIDIIAEKDSRYYFFEVKYRRFVESTCEAFPIENAVMQVKKLRFFNAISHWLHQHNLSEELIEGVYIIYILNKFGINIVKMVQVAL